MSDTNDMRGDFESWFSDEGLYPLSVKRNGNSYGLAQAASAWVAWQAATERATALERERCAQVCEKEDREHMRKFQNTGSAFREDYAIGAEQCAKAIRQGGAG